MKKLLVIIVLSLFYNQVLLSSEVLDSSDKHINLALAKGTKKKIALSPDRVYYAKDYCRKYKKNTYAFKVDSNKFDYDRLGFGKFKVRFICAKNKDEAVENMKWAITNLNYDTVYTVSLGGRSPNVNHIDSAFEDKKKPKTVAKKPEPKKPIENKPEKQISRATNVDSSLITIGSGSGFYINNKGYALTNNHVIDICAQSVAVIDGKETLFRVIATDKTNDVAVLKTDYKSRNYIKINEDGAKLGENVIAVGYPLAGRLSDSVKITRGIVRSLSGLDNNIGQIQIDAALQPGNSGGPVLNESGDLVGIASAGLNKLLMAKEAKYIPENVNFAVASPIVVNILKSKKVKYTTPSMFSGSYSNTELAELGDSSTIQLFCRNTRTAYNRLKSSNKYSTVLLDLD